MDEEQSKNENFKFSLNEQLQRERDAKFDLVTNLVLNDIYKV